MSTLSGSSDFREQIIGLIEASKSNIEQDREAMDLLMKDLESREAVFNQIAEQLRDEILYPILATIADCFDNAKLEHGMLGFSVRCQLLHSMRFPAMAHIGFRVIHNETIDSVTIHYEAQILPVFISFERDDALDLSINSFDPKAVRQWAEQKVLRFLDSYLQIESHEQYQRENIALDPVCGMRVTKPKGLEHEHDGQLYYFCAQRCLDRFNDSPDDYVYNVSK